MAECDDLSKLPLPKGWPKAVERALVSVSSILKAAFDIELGRRADCLARDARAQAEHKRLRMDCATDREVLQLLRARFGRMNPRKRPQYTKPQRLRILELKARKTI